MMKLTVITLEERHGIELEEEGSVTELKEKLSNVFNTPIEQLCLIFAGKVLKDGDNLVQHGIMDGFTVHLVIKPANRTPAQQTSDSPQTPSSMPAADDNATPFGLGSMGGLSGLGNMGMGLSNFVELHHRMQREVMLNPEMLQQAIPNTDEMRQLMVILSNPQMQDLMNQNPEVSHMMNYPPELRRQMLELDRNPAMLPELMRLYTDMNNLESIPGGFNVQEPMMNAAQEGFGSNPFASLAGNNAGSTTPAGTENNAPLPNPWAPASGTTATTSSSTSTSSSSSTSTSTSGSAGGGPFDL